MTFVPLEFSAPNGFRCEQISKKHVKTKETRSRNLILESKHQVFEEKNLAGHLWIKRSKTIKKEKSTKFAQNQLLVTF